MRVTLVPAYQIAATRLQPRLAAYRILRLSGGSSSSSLVPFFHASLGVVNYASGLLLLFSCLVALVNTLIFSVNGLFHTKFRSPFLFVQKPAPPSLTSIRFSLCSMILVSLNFLVAVDVIETLIKPASEYQMVDLYKLAMIAGVRTVLAYFLGKETEELEHELEKSGGEITA